MNNNQNKDIQYFSKINIPINKNIIRSISPDLRNNNGLFPNNRKINANRYATNKLINHHQKFISQFDNLEYNNNINNNNNINQSNINVGMNSEIILLEEPFRNRPSEMLPVVDESYIGVPKRKYFVPMDKPKLDYKNYKLEPHVNKEIVKIQLNKKIENINKQMLIRKNTKRISRENIMNLTVLNTQKENENNKNDSDIKNKGIETAIENDKRIQEEKNSSIKCLQYMDNCLLFKKKYDFHFDLDKNRLNEILNNENERERFKENLKEKLHQDFEIPKDKIIIIFPQTGSLNIKVIIQINEFNDIEKAQFLKRFKNEGNFSEIKTLKEVHEEILMSGCQLSRLLLDPLGNRSEWPKNIENRGGEPYYPPYGWIGIGLKAFDQYENDRWLDIHNQEGEWIVAYHGLGRGMNSNEVNSLIDNIIRIGFKNGNNQIHKNCDDFYHEGKKVGEGIYCTPYVRVAEEYAGISKINGVNYKIVIMVRVNPSARRHCNTCEESRNFKYWVVNPTVDEIRPYRILYKKCE